MRSYGYWKGNGKEKTWVEPDCYGGLIEIILYHRPILVILANKLEVIESSISINDRSLLTGYDILLYYVKHGKVMHYQSMILNEDNNTCSRIIIILSTTATTV